MPILASVARATNLVPPQAYVVPWYEKIDFFQIVVVVVAFFLVRTLKQIDSNAKDTANTLSILSKEFYMLQGEHKVYHSGWSEKGREKR